MSDEERCLQQMPAPALRIGYRAEAVCTPSLLLRDWVPFGFGMEPGLSGQPWSAYGSYLGAPSEWFDLHLPLVPLL